MRCLILFLALCVVAPARAACPAERARYAARGERTITAGFHILPPRHEFISNLAFYVSNAKTGHTFWFGFDGGSAARVALISTTDITAKGWRQAIDGVPGWAAGPLGGMPYLSAGSDMIFGLYVPHRGDPAPRFILLPDFPNAMRDSRYRNEPAPIGVYELTGCTK